MRLDRGVWMVLVMGVAGSGKTTVGRLLAERLGWEFADADDDHPPANRAKMTRGIPLTDADRAPWLDAVARRVAEWRKEGRAGVLACSALKAAYRQRILPDAAGTRVVLLSGDPALLERRLRERRGHFMPPALLDSQLAALEQPAEALRLDVARPPGELVDAVVAWVHS